MVRAATAERQGTEGGGGRFGHHHEHEDVVELFRGGKNLGERSDPGWVYPCLRANEAIVLGAGISAGRLMKNVIKRRIARWAESSRVQSFLARLAQR